MSYSFEDNGVIRGGLNKQIMKPLHKIRLHIYVSKVQRIDRILTPSYIHFINGEKE